MICNVTVVSRRGCVSSYRPQANLTAHLSVFPFGQQMYAFTKWPYAPRSARKKAFTMKTRSIRNGITDCPSRFLLKMAAASRFRQKCQPCLDSRQNWFVSLAGGIPSSKISMLMKPPAFLTLICALKKNSLEEFRYKKHVPELLY